MTETTMENGYVIYPVSIGLMDRDEALRKAAEMSADDPSETYRVEDCDTEQVIARFRDGEAVSK